MFWYASFTTSYEEIEEDDHLAYNSMLVKFLKFSKSKKEIKIKREGTDSLADAWAIFLKLYK